MASQLLLVIVLIANHVQGQNITAAIATFGDQLESYMCDGLRAGGKICSNNKYGIQDFILSFSSNFDTDSSDATDLAQSIIDRLDKKLNQRASFLFNLSHVIRSECAIYGDNDEETESLTEFDSLYFAGNEDRDAQLPRNMEYSDVHSNMVSFTYSTYKLPNGLEITDNIKRDARISQLMDTTMRRLYATHCAEDDGNDEYCNMYYGTVNGLFRQFPGIENSVSSGTYNDYDPRFRPWYVSAATGSKDVVILLDISGSMNDHNRKDLAKEAVISVLNTLGSSSFVNVVGFSDDLTLSCFGRDLVAATSRNVAQLVEFVEDLPVGGLTNFSIAFNAAFDILQSSEQCETVILFLTDGDAPDVTDLIATRNTVDIGAVVFSFTLGDEAKASVPRAVAEQTAGIYTHIDDDDENLITAMSSYYLYYAYGGGSDDSADDIIVTSPYLDFDTSVVMITMALPVYINETYFVGVVATDLPLSFLSDAIGDITIGRKSYSFVMNRESEVILHPLIPNAFELLDDNDEYEAIFVRDVEPTAFIESELAEKMLLRESGATRISATVKQAAGNVVYNGYIYEDAELLYIYSGVGPSSLSIAIVIYSESDVSAPNYPAFGLVDSPTDDCVYNETHMFPFKCLADFNLFHRLDLVNECDSFWKSEAVILNGNDSANADKRYNAFYEGKLYSVDHSSFYLQSGLFEEQYAAINTDPSCEELAEFHTLTNRLGSYDDLIFGGFRPEISQNVLNSVYTLSSLYKFWQSAFLANNSLFVSMYFGHYQGLHISYPAKQFKNTYNNQIRPWYQRAISYPHLMVWTTPYLNAVTQKLVTGGSTVILAPDSDYAFGVAGFDYEYTAFVEYYKSVMDPVCDQSANEYCYLLDSSAMCLYYEGMEHDVDDDDIARKFLGELEPTLMQSLIDREFFINDTNINFIDDTIDITYIVNDAIDTSAFADEAGSFEDNNGEYTVHAVSKTNLYFLHITGYHATDVYPTDCPDNDLCADVVTPGCVTTSSSSSSCISATVDVCIEPETTVTATQSVTCAQSISELGVCALEDDHAGADMCATNFMDHNCGDSKTNGDSMVVIIIIVVAAVVVVIVIIIIVVIKMCSSKKPDDGDLNVQSPSVELGYDTKPSAPPSAPYNPEVYPNVQNPPPPQYGQPYHQQAPPQTYAPQEAYADQRFNM